MFHPIWVRGRRGRRITVVARFRESYFDKGWRPSEIEVGDLETNDERLGEVSAQSQPNVVFIAGEDATGDPAPAQIATAANRDEL